MECSTRKDIKQHERKASEEHISPLQMRAIVLRSNRKKFKEISTELDTPEETIKNWFRENHPVYKHYYKHCYEISYLIGLEAKRDIQRMASLATDTLRELMSDSSAPAIRLKACEYVLNYSFGHVNDVLLLRASEQKEIDNYKSLKELGYVFTESEKADMESRIRAQMKF